MNKTNSNELMFAQNSHLNFIDFTPTMIELNFNSNKTTAQHIGMAWHEKRVPRENFTKSMLYAGITLVVHKIPA